MRWRVLFFLADCTAGLPATAQAQNAPKAGQGTGTTAVVQQEQNLPELTAVGALGASNLYMTFIAVGAIHDNFVSGTYDAATTESLVQSIRGLLASSVEHLQAVQKSPAVSGEDIEFLAGMVDASVNLIGEADSLVRYVQSGNDTDGEEFQREHEKAWQKISGLLNLE